MGTLRHFAICMGLVMLGTSSVWAQGSMQKYGVVEIGSKGIKLVEIEFDPLELLASGKIVELGRNRLVPDYDKKTKEEKDAIKQTIEQEDKQAALVAQEFSEDAAEKVEKQIVAFLTHMDTRAIPVSNRAIVVSSGVAAHANTDERLAILRRIQQKFDGRVRKFDILDVHSEVELSFLELMLGDEGDYGAAKDQSLKANRRAETFFLDVGSGNTKFGARVDNVFHVGEIPVGLSVDVPLETDIAASLTAAIEKSGINPANYKRIILSGGTFFSLMGYAQPGDLAPSAAGAKLPTLVPLRVASIDAYLNRVDKEKMNPDNAAEGFAKDESGLANLQGEHLTNAVAVRKNSLQVIPRRQEAARLIAAVASVLKLQERAGTGDTEILFPVEGHFAWPRGYAKRMAMMDPDVLAKIGQRLNQSSEPRDGKNPGGQSVVQISAEQIADITQKVSSNLLVTVSKELKETVGKELQGAVEAGLKAAVGKELQDAVGAELRVAVGKELKDAIGAALKDAVAANMKAVQEAEESLKKGTDQAIDKTNEAIQSLETAKQEILRALKASPGTPPGTTPPIPVATDPEAAYRAFLRGRDEFDHRRPAQALMLFEEAVRLDGTESLFHYFRAVAEERLGKTKESQASAYRVAELLLSGRSSRDLARNLERVQGPVRVTVEQYVSNGMVSLRKTALLPSLTQ